MKLLRRMRRRLSRRVSALRSAWWWYRTERDAEADTLALHMLVPGDVVRDLGRGSLARYLGPQAAEAAKAAAADAFVREIEEGTEAIEEAMGR